METLKLTIKTPAGEKTFETDDISFGAFEQAVALQEGGLKASQDMLVIFQLFFPTLTKEDFKYVGIKQLQKFMMKDVQEFMTDMSKPVEIESKN